MRALQPRDFARRSTPYSVTCAVFSKRGEVLATYNDEVGCCQLHVSRQIWASSYHLHTAHHVVL